MKEFIFSILVATWAVSMAWWVGTGTNPKAQIIIAGRYLQSSPLLKRFHLSSHHRFALNGQSGWICERLPPRRSIREAG
jgi:hypothetical protein